MYPGRAGLRTLGPFLILACGGAALAAQEHPVAFVNVSVVPMSTAQVLAGQTVVVVAGRIARIGSVNSVRVPDGAARVDGRGRFLMPGLADMHVHLIRDVGAIRQPPPSAVPAGRTIGPASASLDYDRENRILGLLYVSNGITEVRNMWGDEAIDAFAKSVDSGQVLGPHVYSTGPITDGSPYVWVGSRIVQTQMEAEAAVQQDKRAGYFALKIYNGLSAEAYRWLVASARAHELLVVGHVPDAVGLRGVIEARQDSIEHLDGFLEALYPDPGAASAASLQDLLDKADLSKLSPLVESIRDAGIWNCPTLVLWEIFTEDAEWHRKTALVPPALLERYQKMISSWHAKPALTRRTLEFNIAVTRALHQQGARLLLGTDAPKLTVIPGFALHEELQNFVQAGLSPYEAIRAGTRDASIFLHQEKEFGTVEVGRRADLLLLEANPLEDVRNVSRLAGVMISGHWLTAAELQKRLAALHDGQPE